MPAAKDAAARAVPIPECDGMRYRIFELLPSASRGVHREAYNNQINHKGESMNNKELRLMLDEIKTLRRDLFYELLDVHNAGGDASPLTAAYNRIAEAQHELVRFLSNN